MSISVWLGFFLPWLTGGIWLSAIWISACHLSLKRIARALEERNERD